MPKNSSISPAVSTQHRLVADGKRRGHGAIASRPARHHESKRGSYKFVRLRRPPGRPRTTWMKNIHDDPSSLDLGIHEARDLAQNRPLCGLMSLHSLQGWFCHKCILKRGLNGFKPSWRQQVFAAQKPNTLLLLYSARAAVEFGTQCDGLR